MQFLNMTSDFAFKKVFSSEQSHSRLLSLLSAVFSSAIGNELTIKDPYNIPAFKRLKDSWVDVKATSDNGTLLIMEMQVQEQFAFDRRVLYNTARNYGEQLVTGEQYGRLTPVLALTFTDHILFDDGTNAVNYFRFLNEETYTPYNDQMRMAFIELPKFNKPANQCHSTLDQWIYFIKYAGESNMTPEHLHEPVQEAWETANLATMSEEERELYHKRLDFKRSLNGIRQFGEQKGEQKGLEETATRMLNKGNFSVELIAEMTGLSVEQIRQLQQNLSTD